VAGLRFGSVLTSLQKFSNNEMIEKGDSFYLSVNI